MGERCRQIKKLSAKLADGGYGIGYECLMHAGRNHKWQHHGKQCHRDPAELPEQEKDHLCERDADPVAERAKRDERHRNHDGNAD